MLTADLYVYSQLDSGKGDSAPVARLETISIPEALGTIDEIYSSADAKSQATVIYIQDAHDSLEAQKNISKIIHHLVEEQNVQTVFQEGYEGPLEMDAYFEQITNPQTKTKVTDYLLDQLRLGGAEHAHINRTKFFELVGADSDQLHFENIEAYQQASEDQQAIQKSLTEIQKEIRKLTNRYYPKELKAWMKLRERLDEGKLDLLEYIKRISVILNEVKDLSSDPSVEKASLRMTGYSNIDLLLSLDKSPANRHQSLSADIHAKELFGEIDQLEKEIARHHLTDERDRKLFDYDRTIQVFLKLSQMKLSATEYAALLKTMPEGFTQEVANFVIQHSNGSIVFSRKWEENLEHAIHFYKLAQARDLAVENILNAKLKKGNGVLVFGGFHKDAIKEILKRSGYSYLVVTPKISNIEERHQKLYQAKMSEGLKALNFSSVVATAAAQLRDSKILKWNPNFASSFRSEIGSISSVVQAGHSTPQEIDLALKSIQTDPENLVRSEVRVDTSPPDYLDRRGDYLQSRIEPISFDDAVKRMNVYIEKYGEVILHPIHWKYLRKFGSSVMKRVLTEHLFHGLKSKSSITENRKQVEMYMSRELIRILRNKSSVYLGFFYQVKEFFRQQYPDLSDEALSKIAFKLLPVVMGVIATEDREEAEQIVLALANKKIVNQGKKKKQAGTALSDYSERMRQLGVNPPEASSLLEKVTDILGLESMMESETDQAVLYGALAYPQFRFDLAVLGDSLLDEWATQQFRRQYTYENSVYALEGFNSGNVLRMVSNATLGTIMKQTQLSLYLAGGQKSEHAKADVFEAILAAVYLTSGWEAMDDVARRMYARGVLNREKFDLLSVIDVLNSEPEHRSRAELRSVDQNVEYFYSDMEGQEDVILSVTFDNVTRPGEKITFINDYPQKGQREFTFGLPDNPITGVSFRFQDDHLERYNIQVEDNRQTGIATSASYWLMQEAVRRYPNSDYPFVLQLVNNPQIFRIAEKIFVPETIEVYHHFSEEEAEEDRWYLLDEFDPYEAFGPLEIYDGGFPYRRQQIIIKKIDGQYQVLDKPDEVEVEIDGYKVTFRDARSQKILNWVKFSGASFGLRGKPRPEFLNTRSEVRAKYERFDLDVTVQYIVDLFKQVSDQKILPSSRRLSDVLGPDRTTFSNWYSEIMEELKGIIKSNKLAKDVRLRLSRAIDFDENFDLTIARYIVDDFRKHPKKQTFPGSTELSRVLGPTRSKLEKHMVKIQEEISQIIYDEDFNVVLRDRIQLSMDLYNDLQLGVARFIVKLFETNSELENLPSPTPLSKSLGLHETTVPKVYEKIIEKIKFIINGENFSSSLAKRIQNAIENWESKGKRTKPQIFKLDETVNIIVKIFEHNPDQVDLPTDPILARVTGHHRSTITKRYAVIVKRLKEIVIEEDFDDGLRVRISSAIVRWEEKKVSGAPRHVGRPHLKWWKVPAEQLHEWAAIERAKARGSLSPKRSEVRNINPNIVGGQVNLDYLQALQKHNEKAIEGKFEIKPDPGLVGLYVGSGADISTALLTTDADRMIFVNKQPWAYDANSQQPPRLEAYRWHKKTEGWVATSVMDSVEPFIELELQAIGATDVSEANEIEPDVFLLEFTWEGKRRELIYIAQRSVYEPGDYFHLIDKYGDDGQVHISLMKSIDFGVFGYRKILPGGIPINFNDLVVAELLVPGGLLIVEDPANLPLNDYLYQEIKTIEDNLGVQGSPQFGYDQTGALVIQKIGSRSELRSEETDIQEQPQVWKSLRLVKIALRIFQIVVLPIVIAGSFFDILIHDGTLFLDHFFYNTGLSFLAFAVGLIVPLIFFLVVIYSYKFLLDWILSENPYTINKKVNEFLDRWMASDKNMKKLDTILTKKRTWKKDVFVTYLVLLGPIGEEIVYRGFLISAFIALFGGGIPIITGKSVALSAASVGAIVLSSSIFSISHYYNRYTFFDYFLKGIVYATAYVLTGSLFVAIVAHILNNLVAAKVHMSQGSSSSIDMSEIRMPSSNRDSDDSQRSEGRTVSVSFDHQTVSWWDRYKKVAAKVVRENLNELYPSAINRVQIETAEDRQVQLLNNDLIVRLTKVDISRKDYFQVAFDEVLSQWEQFLVREVSLSTEEEDIPYDAWIQKINTIHYPWTVQEITDFIEDLKKAYEQGGEEAILPFLLALRESDTIVLASSLNDFVDIFEGYNHLLESFQHPAFFQTTRTVAAYISLLAADKKEDLNEPLTLTRFKETYDPIGNIYERVRTLFAGVLGQIPDILSDTTLVEQVIMPWMRLSHRRTILAQEITQFLKEKPSLLGAMPLHRRIEFEIDQIQNNWKNKDGIYPFSKIDFKVTVDDSVRVLVSRLFEMQSIHHLLSNAVLALPRDEKGYYQGKIWIVGEVVENDILLTITNETPSIVKLDETRLFIPHESNRRHKDRIKIDTEGNRNYQPLGGMGVGLALSREQTRLHGGTIRYAPEIEEGTAFVIKLPLFNERRSEVRTSTDVLASQQHLLTGRSEMRSQDLARDFESEYNAFEANAQALLLRYEDGYDRSEADPTDGEEVRIKFAKLVEGYRNFSRMFATFGSDQKANELYDISRNLVKRMQSYEDGIYPIDHLQRKLVLANLQHRKWKYFRDDLKGLLTAVDVPIYRHFLPGSDDYKGQRDIYLRRADEFKGLIQEKIQDQLNFLRRELTRFDVGDDLDSLNRLQVWTDRLFNRYRARPLDYPIVDEIPADKVDRRKPYPEYDPKYYVSQETLEKSAEGRHKADPENIHEVDYYDFITYEKEGMLYEQDDETPLNQKRRTGIRGRGRFWRWGPNHAVDIIVVRFNPYTQKIEMLSRKRTDTGQWAIIGGILENEEKALLGMQRHIKAKTGLDIDTSNAQFVFKGQVYDPRETDNAWAETQAAYIYVPYEESKNYSEFTYGKYVSDVQWLPLDPDVIAGLYGDHPMIVNRFLEQTKAHFQNDGRSELRVTQERPLAIFVREADEKLKRHFANEGIEVQHIDNAFDIVNALGPQGGKQRKIVVLLPKQAPASSAEHLQSHIHVRQNVDSNISLERYETKEWLDDRDNLTIHGFVFVTSLVEDWDRTEIDSELEIAAFEFAQKWKHLISKNPEFTFTQNDQTATIILSNQNKRKDDDEFYIQALIVRIKRSNFVYHVSVHVKPFGDSATFASFDDSEEIPVKLESLLAKRHSRTGRTYIDMLNEDFVKRSALDANDPVPFRENSDDSSRSELRTEAESPLMIWTADFGEAFKLELQEAGIEVVRAKNLRRIASILEKQQGKKRTVAIMIHPKLSQNKIASLLDVMSVYESDHLRIIHTYSEDWFQRDGSLSVNGFILMKGLTTFFQDFEIDLSLAAAVHQFTEKWHLILHGKPRFMQSDDEVQTAKIILRNQNWLQPGETNAYYFQSIRFFLRKKKIGYQIEAHMKGFDKEGTPFVQHMVSDPMWDAEQIPSNFELLLETKHEETGLTWKYILENEFSLRPRSEVRADSEDVYVMNDRELEELRAHTSHTTFDLLERDDTSQNGEGLIKMVYKAIDEEGFPYLVLVVDPLYERAEQDLKWIRANYGGIIKPFTILEEFRINSIGDFHPFVLVLDENDDVLNLKEYFNVDQEKSTGQRVSDVQPIQTPSLVQSDWMAPTLENAQKIVQQYQKSLELDFFGYEVAFVFERREDGYFRFVTKPRETKLRKFWPHFLLVGDHPLPETVINGLRERKHLIIKQQSPNKGEMTFKYARAAKLFAKLFVKGGYIQDVNFRSSWTMGKSEDINELANLPYTELMDRFEKREVITLPSVDKERFDQEQDLIFEVPAVRKIIVEARSEDEEKRARAFIESYLLGEYVLADWWNTKRALAYLLDVNGFISHQDALEALLMAKVTANYHLLNADQLERIHEFIAEDVAKQTTENIVQVADELASLNESGAIYDFEEILYRIYNEAQLVPEAIQKRKEFKMNQPERQRFLKPSSFSLIDPIAMEATFKAIRKDFSGIDLEPTDYEWALIVRYLRGSPSLLGEIEDKLQFRVRDKWMIRFMRSSLIASRMILHNGLNLKQRNHLMDFLDGLDEKYLVRIYRPIEFRGNPSDTRRKKIEPLVNLQNALNPGMNEPPINLLPEAKEAVRLMSESETEVKWPPGKWANTDELIYFDYNNLIYWSWKELMLTATRSEVRSEENENRPSLPFELLTKLKWKPENFIRSLQDRPKDLVSEVAQQLKKSPELEREIQIYIRHYFKETSLKAMMEELSLAEASREAVRDPGRAFAIVLSHALVLASRRGFLRKITVAAGHARMKMPGITTLLKAALDPTSEFNPNRLLVESHPISDMGLGFIHMDMVVFEKGAQIKRLSNYHNNKDPRFNFDYRWGYEDNQISESNVFELPWHWFVQQEEGWEGRIHKLVTGPLFKKMQTIGDAAQDLASRKIQSGHPDWIRFYQRRLQENQELGISVGDFEYQLKSAQKRFMDDQVSQKIMPIYHRFNQFYFQQAYQYQRALESLPEADLFYLKDNLLDDQLRMNWHDPEFVGQFENVKRLAIKRLEEKRVTDHDLEHLRDQLEFLKSGKNFNAIDGDASQIAILEAEIETLEMIEELQRNIKPDDIFASVFHMVNELALGIDTASAHILGQPKPRRSALDTNDPAVLPGEGEEDSPRGGPIWGDSDDPLRSEVRTSTDVLAPQKHLETGRSEMRTAIQYSKVLDFYIENDGLVSIEELEAFSLSSDEATGRIGNNGSQFELLIYSQKQVDRLREIIRYMDSKKGYPIGGLASYHSIGHDGLGFIGKHQAQKDLFMGISADDFLERFNANRRILNEVRDTKRPQLKIVGNQVFENSSLVLRAISTISNTNPITRKGLLKKTKLSSHTFMRRLKSIRDYIGYELLQHNGFLAGNPKLADRVQFFVQSGVNDIYYEGEGEGDLSVSEHMKSFMDFLSRPELEGLASYTEIAKHFDVSVEHARGFVLDLIFFNSLRIQQQETDEIIPLIFDQEIVDRLRSIISATERGGLDPILPGVSSFHELPRAAQLVYTADRVASERIFMGVDPERFLRDFMHNRKLIARRNQTSSYFELKWVSNRTLSNLRKILHAVNNRPGELDIVRQDIGKEIEMDDQALKRNVMIFKRDFGELIRHNLLVAGQKAIELDRIKPRRDARSELRSIDVEAELQTASAPARIYVDGAMLASRSELREEVFALAHQTKLMKQFRLVIVNADQLAHLFYSQLSKFKHVRLVRGGFDRAYEENGKDFSGKQVIMVESALTSGIPSTVDQFGWNEAVDIWAALLWAISDDVLWGLQKIQGVYQIMGEGLRGILNSFRGYLVVGMSA